MMMMTSVSVGLRETPPMEIIEGRKGQHNTTQHNTKRMHHTQSICHLICQTKNDSPNRKHCGSFRELTALFSIIFRNSSIRSGLISAWTTTEKGLLLVADMAVRDVLE